MISRTDQHDMDKLGRWLRDLTEPGAGDFPVFAVFLVSEADRTAHDIFRAYRASFEQRGAGFGNLIILGQHGVSSSVRVLLSQLGLTLESIPLLLLLPADRGPSWYMLPLTAGSAPESEGHGLPDAPLELLSRVERFALRVDEAFDGSGLTEFPLPAPDLVTLVNQLAGDLGRRKTS